MLIGRTASVLVPMEPCLTSLWIHGERAGDRSKKYDEENVDVYLLSDREAAMLEVYRRDTAGSWQHRHVTDTVNFQLCETCGIQRARASLFVRA